jgi:hypothetical protein
MAEKSNPILEEVLKILIAIVAIAATLPEAEREILTRRVLDKAWTLLNRCARWLGGKSMLIELRTGRQNYHLPLLCSRIRDWTGVMYERSKDKIL